jgi:hypothetical protein
VSVVGPVSTIDRMVLIALATGWLLLSALALVPFCAIGCAGRREDEAKGYVPDPRPASAPATAAPVGQLQAG